MKYYGGNVPPSPTYVATTHSEHARAWEFRRQLSLPIREAMPVEQIPQEIVDQLTDTRPPEDEFVIPPASELVDQIPDTVFWLLGQKTSQSKRGDEQGVPSGKPGSKPPFRIAFMAAADREFAALAHWAGIYGITTPHRVSFQLDDHGRAVITGMAVNGYAALFDLAFKLYDRLAADERAGEEPAYGILDDPHWGLWKIRQQHYAMWPDLQLLFAAAKEPVIERADLNNSAPEQEEALF